MAREFKETAHLKTDLNKYAENFDHIFRKYKCNCHLFEDCSCDTCKPKADETHLDGRVVAEDFGPCDL